MFLIKCWHEELASMPSMTCAITSSQAKILMRDDPLIVIGSLDHMPQQRLMEANSSACCS